MAVNTSNHFTEERASGLLLWVQIPFAARAEHL